MENKKYIRICENSQCKKVFLTSYPQTKYCGSQCVHFCTKIRTKRKPNKKYVRTCANTKCEKSFHTSYPKTRCCSRQCAAIWSRGELKNKRRMQK